MSLSIGNTMKAMERVKGKVARLMKMALEILIPEICPLCNHKLSGQKEGLCRNCLEKIGRLAGNSKAIVCNVCGYPTDSQTAIMFNGNTVVRKQTAHNERRSQDLNSNTIGIDEATMGQPYVCEECKTKQPSFVKARSYCIYNERVGILVSALKYKDRIDLIKPIAKLIQEVYKWELATVAEEGAHIITGVPMDAVGARKRMYNQSIMLAKALTKEIKNSATLAHNKRSAGKITMPQFVHNLLAKTRQTKKQTTLSRSGRLTNLKGAMVARPIKSIRSRNGEGVNILIVDDIITTGATIEEAARAIKEVYPSAKVSAISLARTIKSHSK